MPNPDAADSEMARQSPNNHDGLLPYYEFNTSKGPTVLLLHGAMSSPHEYRQLIPRLKPYHILVPFLPGHGTQARKAGTSLSDVHNHFTLAGAAEAISKLISEFAHLHRAHVVGVSLGAHLGFVVFARGPWHSVLPYAMLASDYLEDALPGRFSRWLLEADLRNDEAVSSLQLAKEVIEAVDGEAIRDVQAVKKIPVRSLVFAALKRGMIVPTDDNIEDAIMLGKHLRASNRDSKVAYSKMMRHYWQLQNPAMFAATVITWIEGFKLPDQLDIVDLDTV